MTRVASVPGWVTISLPAQQPIGREMARTFDSAAFATLDVPHPDPRYTRHLVPADYYCASGRQRSGHIERLEQQESRSTLNPTWQVAQDNRDRLDDVRESESDTLDLLLTFGCQETFIYVLIGGLTSVRLRAPEDCGRNLERLGYDSIDTNWTCKS